MKIKDILKKDIIKDILTNVIYLILVVVFFIVFNAQASLLDSNTLLKYIDISSIIFLFIAIVMFEIGYKKDKTKIFIYGIEFLVLAIFTFLIKHMPKAFGYTMKEYTEVGIYAYIAYYILKSGIQYTITKQKELNSLSDIKEIVKEEPTKKATKRKNIKMEEGK